MSPHHRSPIAKRCVYIVLATEVLDAQLDLPRLHPLGRGSLLDTLGCVLLDALHWRLGTYHDHFIKLAMMHERAYDPLQLGANALSRYGDFHVFERVARKGALHHLVACEDATQGLRQGSQLSASILHSG